jgi:hypothetical protein
MVRKITDYTYFCVDDINMKKTLAYGWEPYYGPISHAVEEFDLGLVKGKAIVLQAFVKYEEISIEKIFKEVPLGIILEALVKEFSMKDVTVGLNLIMERKANG